MYIILEFFPLTPSITSVIHMIVCLIRRKKKVQIRRLHNTNYNDFELRKRKKSNSILFKYKLSKPRTLRKTPTIPLYLNL